MTTAKSATATMTDNSKVTLVAPTYSDTTDVLTIRVAGTNGKSLSIYDLQYITIA